MLAFACPWNDAAREHLRGISTRLSASLCSGIGGHSGAAEVSDLHFAYRPPRSTAALSRAWRPTILPDGRIAVFHGYFDNLAGIAAELGAENRDPALVYARAVERWGDESEHHVVGEYCALVADPRSGSVQLSRSPLRAPPLFYYHRDGMTLVASVPRAIFAAGAEQQLNERRIADITLVNFTDRESSAFEHVYRVPHGHRVELEPGRERALRKCYDVLALPPTKVTSPADCVRRASELLDEGVRACLAGFRRPGATLSGGLDTPQVVVRALAAMPADMRLPTFTFHPEPGFDGRVEPGKLGNERPFVEAFAAMHPRIEPHFTANEGYEHDYRWNDFYHLMGSAPSGLCNMYVFHGLFAGAAKAGCDVLLLAEWGNFTFSDKGTWGFVEYLYKGRWIELWRALRDFPNSDKPLLWRFVAQCLMPLLPNRLWRLVRRLVLREKQSLLDLMQPLSWEYRVRSGAQQRLEKSNVVLDRFQPWNRRHAVELLFRNLDSEADEIYQAFEQMYGVPQRDPTAYRPFVEFCLGLPTSMFLRDGKMRWLAKEMAKGIMPEEQRINRLNGRWDSDWHVRIGRRRKDFLAEIDRLERDERLAGMLDLPRLRAGLENWSDQTELDPAKYYTQEFAVPRALLTARFIDYVEGRNTR